MDATPTDAILKDEDGYVISGKWECENGIVVELADNVLTISGKGTLGKDVRKIITKTIPSFNYYLPISMSEQKLHLFLNQINTLLIILIQ